MPQNRAPCRHPCKVPRTIVETHRIIRAELEGLNQEQNGLPNRFFEFTTTVTGKLMCVPLMCVHLESRPRLIVFAHFIPFSSDFQAPNASDRSQQ